MRVVFFAAFELLGWMLGQGLPVERHTPVWARIAGAFLVVVGALAGAVLVTLAAAFVAEFVQVLLSRA